MRHASLWMATGLILLLCASRLIGIAVFPPFIDETIHIHSGEIILQNRTPFQDVILGRQLTIWWMMLFQPAAGAAPMWVARVATLLAVLPGFAALLSVARQSGGRWALVLFGLLYVFSTYHFFFERLALADPIAGSCVALAIAFAYRLSRRVRLLDALLAGGCLFAAFLAKTSAAPSFGVPIAAALALTPASRTWRSSLGDRLCWLGAALVTAFGLTAVFIVGLKLHGYDVITNSLSLAVSARGTVSAETILSPLRVMNNVSAALGVFADYYGALALIALLIGVLLLILRGRWYLPLCLLGPLLVIWLSTVQETRYYVTSLTLLLLCAGIALALQTQQHPLLRWLALAVTVAWGLIAWLPFALTAARAPEALPLPFTDYQQYVLSDASGFGFAEVYAALRERQPRQVFGALSNCQGLRFSLPHDFPLTCPPIHPDGQDRAALAALFQANRSTGTYVVLEASPYVPASAPGRVVAVIDVGRPRLTIYDLAP